MTPLLEICRSVRPHAVGVLVLVCLIRLPLPAVAAGDHAHGAAPAAASGPAWPRFSARSDRFEVVGVLNGGEVSMLIDHHDSNAPLLGAQVAIESGPFKAAVPFHADHGDYALPSEPFNKPGTYPVTLTVTADGQTDRLVAELVVPAAETTPASDAHASRWRQWLGGAMAIALMAAAALWARRHTRSRQNKPSRPQ